MGWFLLWWTILLLPALLAVPLVLLVWLVLLLALMSGIVTALSRPKPSLSPLDWSWRDRTHETEQAARLPGSETRPARATLTPAERSFADTLAAFDGALRRRLARLDSCDSLSREHAAERQTIIETLERLREAD